MRAVAITFVLVSHVSLFFPNYNNIITDSLQVLGLYGVEIFFVLSGFLIGGILLQGMKVSKFSFKNVCHFWIRRWFRTLPLYFFILFINVLLLYLFDAKTPEKLWKYWVFLQNFKDEYLTFFPESWSLSIEEYAYLIAPLGLFLLCKIEGLSKKRNGNLFLINALVLCLLFLITKTIFYFNNMDNMQSFKSWNINLKSMVVFRLDSIFIGFILVYFYKKYLTFFERHKWKFGLIGAMCLFLLMASIIIYPIEKGNTFYWNVLFLPLSSMSIGLILPFLYFIKFQHKVFRKFIEKVSLYSYSMYLLHYSFTFFFVHRFLDLDGLSLVKGFIYTSFYLVFVFFLSKVSYTFFEKPITDLRDSETIKRLFS